MAGAERKGNRATISNSSSHIDKAPFRAIYSSHRLWRWSLTCAQHGRDLEVRVLPRADHSERREAQLRKGDRAWGGSVERNHEPMDKNQIGGTTCQGEWA